MNLTCQVLSDKEVLCNDVLYKIPEEKYKFGDEWFFIYLGIYVGLVLFAGE